MKKKIFILFMLIFIVLIGSFVSASWFSDFWDRITGRVVGVSCRDSSACGPGEGCAFINQDLGMRCVLCSSEYLCNGGPPNTANGGRCGDYGGCNCGECSGYFGSGYNCVGNKCVKACTPNCAGRVCGPDPICGQSCGICTTGTCINGQCGGGETCTDSDKSPSYMDGLDYYTKGTATKGSVSYTDECLADGKLKEAYCSGGSSGTPSTLNFNCSTVPFNGNWVCQEGKCVKLPTCTNAADCDDDNLCIDDSCESGNCKYAPINCPDGEICDPDTGNCIPSTCSLPSAVSGVSVSKECQKCDEKTGLWVADPAKKGHNCKTNDNKDGFCDENGNCKEKTCANVFGSGNWHFCPTTGNEDTTKCCKGKIDDSTGEKCCQDEGSKPPICCDKQTRKCDKVSGFLAEKLEPGNLCYINPGGCTDPRMPNRCEKDGNTVCCENALNYVCTSQLLGKVPTCGRKNKCNPDEFKAGDVGPLFSGHKLCCKTGLQKKKRIKLVVLACVDIDCPDGEFLCEGTGQAEDRMNKCCPDGTVCWNDPNGFPKCIPLTSGGKQTSSGIASTTEISLDEYVDYTDYALMEIILSIPDKPEKKHYLGALDLWKEDEFDPHSFLGLLQYWKTGKD